jgi:hypothetical protein
MIGHILEAAARCAAAMAKRLTATPPPAIVAEIAKIYPPADGPGSEMTHGAGA